MAGASPLLFLLSWVPRASLPIPRDSRWPLFPTKSAKKDAPEEETSLAQYALSLTVSVLISAMLDPNIMSKSGRILVTAELAHEYGFKDFGG